LIFSKNKVYLIAEIANSHEGNFETAKKLIDVAHSSNADIVKFQLFKTAELLEKNHESFHIFQKLEMKNSEWSKLITFAKRKKIKVFFDVFGISSAKIAYKLKPDGFKIHTSDITNSQLLNFFSKSKKPILLSTGGVTTKEISYALELLTKNNKEIILMHGFQDYPTKLLDLNLLRITELKRQFGLPVGIMEHVSGNSDMALIAPLLGMSLGATIIEKHLTLDRSLKGTDYFSSLNPNEFKTLSKLIHSTKQSLGSKDLIFSKNELLYRLKHKKNTITKRPLKKNTSLNENLFTYKRTKLKKESVPYYEFNYKLTKNKIKKGEILTNNLLKSLPRIAAVIACRVESGRLFGKPIQNLSNFTILDFLIYQIKTSNKISEVVLAVSENQGNQIFIDYAKKNNLKFVIGDDRDVLQRLIKGAELVDANIVFRVTSENPFIYWEGIDTLIKKHIKENSEFSFIDNLPIGSGYEIINLESLKKSHKFGNKRHRSELCSLYIYEHQKDFKILRSQPSRELKKPHLRLTVDTPEDLLVARKIYENLGSDLKPIPLKRIINFLEKYPNITEINSNIPLGVTRIWD